MRRLAALYALAATLFAWPALAADLPANSHITAVTVYPDRATVTRQAVVEVPQGASAVVFDGLPATVDPQSLRAEGSATAQVTLGAVDSKLVNGIELAAPRERDLNDQLQKLQDQRALLQADVQANDARRSFLANLGQQAEDTANDDIAMLDLKPEQWAGAANTIYSSMDDAFKAAAAQTVALRQIDQRLAGVQADLDQLETGQRSTMRVAVPLDAAAGTTLTLKLTYQVPQATWSPLYDARLETASPARLTIAQFGEVRQSTGEDWTDVALTLSTAEPARGATPPPVGTKWVDLLPPPQNRPVLETSNRFNEAVSAGPSYENAVRDMNQKRVMQAEESGASTIPPAYAIKEYAPATAAMPAIFQTATIQTGGFVGEYRIQGLASVTADNTAHKVMIGTVDSTVDLVEQVRPALGTEAFLVARTKIGGDVPLLPGKANLFRDGVFTGTSEFKLVQPGEETPLSFGIDDQIAVKRRSVEDNNGSAGILSKDATRERKFVTSLHNLHRYPVRLEVMEALPVPRNDKISVEVLQDATTAGYMANADNTTGLALWKLDMAAGAQQDVRLGWRVSWPADEHVIGLP